MVSGRCGIFADTWYENIEKAWKVQPPRGVPSTLFLYNCTRCMQLTCAIRRLFLLLPLDGSVRLWREVVAYAVHCRDLCEDSVSDFLEDRPLDLLDSSSHCVDSVHGADDYWPII